MKKTIYIYSEEEEQKINEKLGYTKEQLIHTTEKKQVQYTIGIKEIRNVIHALFHRKCPGCGTKLITIRELKYIGLRHPPGATGGCYQKTYEVRRFRLCPECDKIKMPIL